MQNSFFSKMIEANPEAEIWWDSCLSVHNDWCNELVQQHNNTDKHTLANAYIRNFIRKDDIAQSFIKGITTNPSLVYKGFLKSDISKKISNENIKNYRADDHHQLTWDLYKLTLTESAEQLMPLWEASSGKYGWVCAQVTPDSIFNKELMLKQSLEFAKLAPNIMAKIPGSKEGYEIIEELTALGISTNNTLSYTLPQFLACLEAIEKGLERAKQNNISVKNWRAVVTDMIGRFGDNQALTNEAKEKGIHLTYEDIRWAELAILKKTYGIFQKRKTPLKILLASLRVETDQGMCMHLQKTAGANLVYTLPPSFIQTILEHEERLAKPNASAMEEEIPTKVMQKLESLEYFTRGYNENGLSKDEFNQHPALLFSVNELTNIYGEFLELSKKLLNS